MRYYVIFTCFILLIELVACTTSEYDKKAMKLHEEAKMAHQYGQYDVALEKYREAIKLDHHFYPPHLHKRSIYIKQGAYEKALLESELLIRKKPDLVEGWLIGGALYDTLGDRISATAYYQQSIRLLEKYIIENQGELLGQEDSIAFRMHKTNLAYTHILLGNKATGTAILRQFIPLSKVRIDTMINRMWVLQALIETDPALKKGITLYPWHFKES
jgi:tetratricopeptide (TPR) repeat protein